MDGNRITKYIVTIALACALASLAVPGGATEKLRIGTAGAYPPFNYMNSDGELIGFDVEIGEALCVVADYECKFVVQDWENIIPGLLAKRYDVIIASISITEERKQLVDFTAKYYSTPAKFVAKTDADFETTPEGLAEKSIGVQEGSAHEAFVTATFPLADIRAYPTQDEANQALVAGELDLVMADSVALLEGFLSTEEGKGHGFIGPDFNEPDWHGEGAGIAVRKGEDDLRQRLNAAIVQIRSNGTYQRIQGRYFDFDIYGKPPE